MLLTQISEVYTPPISGWAMRTFGPYGLYVVSGCICFSSIFILPFLPETLPKQHPSGASTPLEASDIIHVSNRFHNKIKRRLDEFKRHFREGILPLFRAKYLGACFAALSLSQLPRPLLLFYMQYVLARFEWKIENVSCKSMVKTFLIWLMTDSIRPSSIGICENTHVSACDTIIATILDTTMWRQCSKRQLNPCEIFFLVLLPRISRHGHKPDLCTLLDHSSNRQLGFGL
jgi:hypothetical protein